MYEPIPLHYWVDPECLFFATELTRCHRLKGVYFGIRRSRIRAILEAYPIEHSLLQTECLPKQRPGNHAGHHHCECDVDRLKRRRCPITSRRCGRSWSGSLARGRCPITCRRCGRSWIGGLTRRRWSGWKSEEAGAGSEQWRIRILRSTCCLQIRCDFGCYATGLCWLYGTIKVCLLPIAQGIISCEEIAASVNIMKISISAIARQTEKFPLYDFNEKSLTLGRRKKYHCLRCSTSHQRYLQKSKSCALARPFITINFNEAGLASVQKEAIQERSDCRFNSCQSVR